jgi:GNAT superfamily N-acetyltransferase
MTWPAFIVDRNGRKFAIRPKEFDADGLRYYQAEIFSEEDEEAGYLWFRDERKEWLLLHDVEVYERFSRVGLGPQLIAIAESEARRLGKERIIGHVEARCQLWGKKAELATWYRNLGYQVTQTDFSEKNYYGPLEKKLLQG